MTIAEVDELLTDLHERLTEAGALDLLHAGAGLER
jgi:hypothetical protein